MGRPMTFFRDLFLIGAIGILLIDCSSLGTKNKAPDLESAVKTVAGDLKNQFVASAKSQGGKIPGRLGILNIVNGDGSKSQLGGILTDKLTKELFDPNVFILLERDRLNRVVGEQTFQESGLVLSDQVISLGKLSGAEYLLLGQILFEDQDFLLNLRIVSLAGIILATTEVRFDSNDETFSKFRERIQ